MIELRTLGRVDLGSRDREGPIAAAAQPKRLALLVYLVVADETDFHRRDALVARFWPELDTVHARGALRQALHALRRGLGAVIVTRGEEEIGVNRELISCDAASFRAHADAGRFREALDLYRGEFLDAFFVSDISPELEEWIEHTRANLRRRAAACAGALSETARECGDLTAAVAFARSAASMNGDDERHVARLIAMLDAAGDRSGALDEFAALASRLKIEYDAEPAPETQSVIARIRDRDAPYAVPAMATPRPAERSGMDSTERSTRRGGSFGQRAVWIVIGIATFSAGLAFVDHERKFVPTVARPVTRDSMAMDAYTRGRHYWNERREPSLLLAVSLFTNALHADPTFALAYSAMGDAYVQLGYTNALSPADAFPKARAAAERALALDSSLAEPHAALAFVDMYYDYDWPAAQREFRSAIAANPSYATAHEWYGLYLAAMGQFDEARREEARAQELDPLSIAIAGTAGFIDYYAGNTDRAMQALRVALRGDSAFPLGHFYLGRVYQQMGEADSALAEYRATGPLRTWGPTIIAEGQLLGTMGRSAASRATLARMDSLSRTHYVTAYGYALVYAALNEPDSAFAWLERGYKERTNWMVWLNRDPRWAGIRKDPRFAALSERMRLPK